jgi:hypothetical protein
MTFAFEVPGYLQGHRFSDSERFYDQNNKTFKDLAGFDDFGNGLVIDIGSPKFENIGGLTGILLDNTYHGHFRHAITWQGSSIFVLKPKLNVAETATIYPLLFGDGQANVGANLTVMHFSGERRIIWKGSGGDTAPLLTFYNDDLVIFGFSNNQENRSLSSTKDGVTINSATQNSNPDSGNEISMSSALSGCRFGNLSGTAGDTAQMTSLQTYMFEQHFFAGDIFADHPVVAKSFMDSLKSKYGISG